jgi:Flp pilus assembly protein TadD
MAREHERLLREVADTHYNMGALFSAKNDYSRAAKEFQKVVELKPDDGDAYYNLGVIYAEHLPDRDKATVFFRKYLQLNPHAKDASWVKQYIASWRAWEAKERLE